VNLREQYTKETGQSLEYRIDGPLKEYMLWLESKYNESRLELRQERDGFLTRLNKALDPRETEG